MEATGGGGREIAEVLSEDPSLGEGLDRATLARAQRFSKVPVVRVATGAWRPLEVEVEQPVVAGFLVLEGWIVRRTGYGDKLSADLLGRGDVIRRFEGVSGDLAYVPARFSWQVLEECRLGMFDTHFLFFMHGYPEVAAALLDRLGRREEQLAQRLSMAKGRLDVAVHLLLWQLAERFGEREESTVLVDAPLGHDLLAELIAASRPAVSRELGKLQQAGLVSRVGQGWRLHGRPPEGAGEAGLGRRFADV